MRLLITLSYLFLTLLPLVAQQRGSDATTTCPTVKINAERLADLNVARSGHMVLCVNGEPMVMGGHTTNFVPTPTAEYYNDGAWQLVQLAYSHDDGCAVELSTGKVLITGGHERELGIGQTFTAELYDPVSHTTMGFGSLDTKRAQGNALALDDDRVLLSGNWYHDDAIEMYDGKGSFLPVKGTNCNRATPYIMRTAKDDAIFFSGIDSKGVATPHPMIDRLHGEAYREPLLEEWGVPCQYYRQPACAFIGDESKGDYSYLLLVENEQGQSAIARVTNGEFSLLPTDVPVPRTCNWGGITYSSQIYVDRQSQRAYLIGTDPGKNCIPPKLDLARLYVLIIDYATVPARLTLGYTDALNDLDINTVLMTADGNLMMVGGVPTQNNFKPSATTWLIHVSPRAQAADTGVPWWKWCIAILAIAALGTMLFMLWCRRKHAQGKEMLTTVTEEPDTVTVVPAEVINQEAPDDGETDIELMQRICHVMEEQQLFLNPDLKVADIASVLGINRTAISNCINSLRECTFRQFVNAYRVAHAQELLHSKPDITITEVWMASGFSSESSFYRIFKATTGTTPKDRNDITAG